MTIEEKRSDRVIRFIECLTVPSGVGAGGPFELREWQKKFIRDIYDPMDFNGKRIVRRAVKSIARKNGKTGDITLISFEPGICATTGVEMSVMSPVFPLGRIR